MTHKYARLAGGGWITALLALFLTPSVLGAAAGDVIAWGLNDRLQGVVPNISRSSVVAIAAGEYHNVVLRADGSVAAWGLNFNGQTTVPAAASSGVIRIAAGGRHSLALKADGSVLGWGDTVVPAAA